MIRPGAQVAQVENCSPTGGTRHLHTVCPISRCQNHTLEPSALNHRKFNAAAKKWSDESTQAGFVFPGARSGSDAQDTVTGPASYAGRPTCAARNTCAGPTTLARREREVAKRQKARETEEGVVGEGNGGGEEWRGELPGPPGIGSSRQRAPPSCSRARSAARTRPDRSEGVPVRRAGGARGSRGCTRVRH